MGQIGGPIGALTREDVDAFVADELGALDVDGRSVCLVVPDATRTCPLPTLLVAFGRALRGRASRVTVLIALGTHAPMSPPALARHLGGTPAELAAVLGHVEVRNHEWDDPETFVEVGVVPASQVRALSGGLLDIDVPVRINRAVIDHDLTVLVGPVLPHEVVGFSGGNKYLFPGLSGPEMIDVSHWLGARLSSAAIIGTLDVTPVRALIDAAAALVPADVHALCVVPGEDGALHAAAFGAPTRAWADAAAVAAVTHVRYLDAPAATVLSLVAPRYDDLWTAAKGFYKVEPIVADGGNVILYAPHVTEIAPMHPGVEEIGYHCCAYFTEQWERFAHRPWGELAHSTHLRGAGTYDPVHGERCRVTVTLATGISRARTEAVGLAWMDPAEVDVAAFERDPTCRVVPHAGEVLYRLADATHRGA